MNTATSYLQSALEEAQIRALRNLRSYLVQLEQQEVWLESKQSSRWQAEQLWEVLLEGVSVAATRWPSFSASGFAARGTLTLQLEDWTRQVRVSPVGRIYQP